MKLRRLLLGFSAAVLLLVAAGCSDERALQPLPDDAIILAFGDSLTVGVGALPEQSYPRRLALLTGMQVVGSGVSGETTAQGLQRLPSVLKRHQPKLMILLEGGNDILRNRSAAETKTNLAAMITIARSQGVEVVLIGVPEKKLFSDSAPFYGELAVQFGVVYDGDILAGLIRSPSLKSDAIHLNASGYQRLAEKIAELLRESGALR